MTQQDKTIWNWVLGAHFLCLITLLSGLFFIASPFWMSAGVLGWYEGYDPKTDVMGIVWLFGTFGSIFIGLILTAAAAFVGISLGIATGLSSIASRKRQSESPHHAGASLNETQREEPSPSAWKNSTDVAFDTNEPN